MSLYAGRLRHRIAIEQSVETQDPVTGDVTITWETLYPSVPAAFDYLSAKEFISASALQAQMVARVTIRALPNLTAKMRIIYQGKIFDPTGWLPDNDSGLEYLTAPVSAGVNDG